MGARGGSTGSPEASAAAARPPTHHRSRPAPAPPSSADQGEASTNTTGPDRTTDAVTNRWSADHEWPTESGRAANGQGRGIIRAKGRSLGRLLGEGEQHAEP